MVGEMQKVIDLFVLRQTTQYVETGECVHEKLVSLKVNETVGRDKGIGKIS